jgi:hypothetical protein
MTTPIINGKTYSWSDIKLTLLGRTLVGISDISYEDSEDINPVRGQGKFPVNYVQGNYNAQASITLEMSEVEMLQKLLPSGQRLQDIKPFNITIIYTNYDAPPVKHVLKGCKFKGNNRKSSAGTVEEIKVQFELYVTQIFWS